MFNILKIKRILLVPAIISLFGFSTLTGFSFINNNKEEKTREEDWALYKEYYEREEKDVKNSIKAIETAELLYNKYKTDYCGVYYYDAEHNRLEKEKDKIKPYGLGTTLHSLNTKLSSSKEFYNPTWDAKNKVLKVSILGSMNEDNPVIKLFWVNNDYKTVRHSEEYFMERKREKEDVKSIEMAIAAAEDYIAWTKECSGIYYYDLYHNKLVKSKKNIRFYGKGTKTDGGSGVINMHGDIYEYDTDAHEKIIKVEFIKDGNSAIDYKLSWVEAVNLEYYRELSDIEMMIDAKEEMLDYINRQHNKAAAGTYYYDAGHSKGLKIIPEKNMKDKTQEITPYGSGTKEPGNTKKTIKENDIKYDSNIDMTNKIIKIDLRFSEKRVPIIDISWINPL